ncbi:hypothetical protein COT78_01440 [Candidatus Berkelbacteria bacterium CG10_big_fil_rev_8_21_14_0_10_43_13]|uniref:POTRA domain-containing protein n=1 Tax=Candidatus Berkelbacteria bacterium CG10_big_fil_rev_8_21_14_0_10_43_13 TaxID=1974514 RepID=A0A2H0W948_9BACT|nr:MAG: hypothetical protein COT78_01440 [Candidatus Berkelbacteria bacterium CG10_big_fil_rev_8_21_14_0_10_43_13]
MVKEYYKKTYPSANKYRSPKIYRPTRGREKTKFKLSPARLKFLLILIIILVVLYYFFASSQFQVKEIIIEGNSLVSKDEIVSILPQGKNIFLFNTEKSRSEIVSKFPEIKQVAIYRGVPDALKIVVLERENKMVWQTNSDLYYVSAKGYVTRKIVTKQIGSLPVVVDTKNLPIKLGQELVSPNFVAFITNVFSSFQIEEGIKPLNFEIPETTFNINLKTEAGFYVKLNSLRSSQKQLGDLKKILTQYRDNIHEYVDLRIDGWAYYK